MTPQQVFTTGKNSIDLLAPLVGVGKSVLFVGAGVCKTLLITELINNMVGQYQGISRFYLSLIFRNLVRILPERLSVLLVISIQKLPFCMS